MLTIYRRFWQVNWAEQWQYRANLVMYLFYWLVSPVVYLSVWTTVARSQGDVQGMTVNDFITYYLTLLVVDQLTTEISLHLLASKIQDGTLAGELLRPVHPVLTNTLVNNIAFKALIFMVFLPIWGGLVLLFRPDYSMVTLPNLLLALPAIALGFTLNFLLGAALTCLAFWTTRIYSLLEFYYGLAMLLSGQFVPLQLLPPVLQNIAQYLPFQFMIYFPVQIILGKITWQAALPTFALGLVWLAAAYIFFRLIWRQGLKHFSAVGA